jgi:hypothetical protein
MALSLSGCGRKDPPAQQGPDSSGDGGQWGGSSGDDGQQQGPIGGGVVDDTPGQTLEGDVVGKVGTKYETKWFSFTVNSMTTGTTYQGYSAASGNTLVISNITITSTSSTPQSYGTFDWRVDDDTLAEYIYPMDPITGVKDMMPASFELSQGQTATYNVIIEYPSSLPSPVLMYIEAGESGTRYSTFVIPIR